MTKTAFLALSIREALNVPEISDPLKII
jgi:hypothetical protein